jgi:hypothetical protein
VLVLVGGNVDIGVIVVGPVVPGEVVVVPSAFNTAGRSLAAIFLKPPSFGCTPSLKSLEENPVY